MTNNDTATNATADAMRAASDRRLAEMRATPIIMPDRPARRDIRRSHRHSVKHRAIR